MIAQKGDITLWCSAYVYGLDLAAAQYSIQLPHVKILLRGLHIQTVARYRYLLKLPMLFAMVGLLLYWQADYYDPLVVILRCWFHFSGQRHAFGLWCKKAAYEKACAYRDLFHMEGMDVRAFFF